MTTSLPNETAFFRCVAAITLPRPTRNVNPHLYFDDLERGRTFRLNHGFRNDVQPTFNPEGKADPSDRPHIVYVWELKAPRPFAMVFKNWPGHQVIPWYYFEPLVKGECTFMSFQSSPQVALANGAVQTALPVLSIVRLYHDRTGHRPVWNVRSEGDITSQDSCSTVHRFLSLGGL